MCSGAPEPGPGSTSAWRCSESSFSNPAAPLQPLGTPAASVAEHLPAGHGEAAALAQRGNCPRRRKAAAVSAEKSQTLAPSQSGGRRINVLRFDQHQKTYRRPTVSRARLKQLRKLPPATWPIVPPYCTQRSSETGTSVCTGRKRTNRGCRAKACRLGQSEPAPP